MERKIEIRKASVRRNPLTGHWILDPWGNGDVSGHQCQGFRDRETALDEARQYHEVVVYDDNGNRSVYRGGVLQ